MQRKSIVSSKSILKHGMLTLEVRTRLHPDSYCHADEGQSSLSYDILKLFLEVNS